MDETTRGILERITVRFDRPTLTPSGHTSSVFYDSVRLTPNDLARLAADAVGHLSEDTFDLALGLAYPGIFFAAAVAGGKPVAILTEDDRIIGPLLTGLSVVIVDDVVASGSRLQRGEKRAREAGANVVGYACIVDRSSGSFGTPMQPLWSALQTDML